VRQIERRDISWHEIHADYFSRIDETFHGGFSDAVFNVVASFLSDDANRFVAEVDSIEL
jgi:hypothetical protein